MKALGVDSCCMNRWVNFLSLIPGTTLTLLVISIAFLRFYAETDFIAFLRFYDVQDFPLLGFIAQPRLWSNRFTVAALVATLANFGVEWNRRNRETNRLAVLPLKGCPMLGSASRHPTYMTNPRSQSASAGSRHLGIA
jgi:hypothetical protein